MSNARRGLSAAGLAAAVIAATGAGWTLAASAEESPATVPAVEPAADAEPVPPKVLPWGSRPARLTRGRAGASSAAVAAAGADAAPADTSGSLLPVPEFAPKGRNFRSGSLKQEMTSLVPPAPPAAGPARAEAAETAEREVRYHYAVGSQSGETDGSWANLHLAKPFLAEKDSHTLTEIALQSADGKQIVEVGWTVDRMVNGDTDPHLFVFYWKDGEPTCYNACGFRQYSDTVKPGDTLPVSGQKRFGIQHANGVWWVAYDSEWIGYFPDRLWDGDFTRAGLTQWFGEVAAATNWPCTDMGNGEAMDSDTASRIGTISMTNGPDPKAAVRATNKYYGVQSLSDRTFRFGGNGAC